MSDDLLRYCVLQNELGWLDPDALKRAFEQVPQLVSADALAMARGTFGILAEDLPRPDAARLREALAIEGIFTQVVPSHTLAELPPPRPLPKASATLTALVACDALGRETWIDWPKVVVVAAGKVPMPAVEKSEGAGPAGVGMMRMTSGAAARERAEPKLILDLVLNVQPGRYRIEATQFNYEYLRPDATAGAVNNFKALVLDFAGHADWAALNGGAAGLREDVSQLYEYPSKQAFEEEIVWLLWKRSQPS